MAEACYNKLNAEKSYLKGSQIFVYHTGKDEVYKKEGINNFPTKTLILQMVGNTNETADLNEYKSLAEVFGVVEQVFTSF
jgi:hypothetical protein